MNEYRAAFAQKYKGEKNCTFAMYGDGASNQGQVFEAFNMVRSSLYVLLYSLLPFHRRISRCFATSVSPAAFPPLPLSPLLFHLYLSPLFRARELGCCFFA